MTKAIILLSGGLDSTVVLALALAQKKQCYTLSFDYGQRHRIELQAAVTIANHYQVSHHCIKIDQLKGSALTDATLLPTNTSLEEIANQGIPSSYVPARNTLFLSYALAQAERHQAQEIHFGPNKLDQACYPDCRPTFIQAFQSVIDATARDPIRLVTPLMCWNKVEIIRQGLQLNAPLHLTMSCYNPSSQGTPCTQCDACVIRQLSFQQITVD